MKVIEAEKIVEILSDIRAQYNCFDRDELAGYEAISDAIARVNENSFIEPKRGKWIDKGWKGDWEFETGGRGNCWHEYECSECGFHKKRGKSNFCPNCGADMRERENER